MRDLSRIYFVGSSAHEIGASGTLFMQHGPNKYTDEITGPNPKTTTKLVVDNGGRNYPQGTSSRGKINLFDGR